MRFLILFFLSTYGYEAVAQEKPGIIIGNILDEKNRSLEGATVVLSQLKDSTISRSVITDVNGAFRINEISFGIYRLKITYTGFQVLIMDSINIRADRYDFNLNDIILKPAASEKLEEVIIYSEKPLIQSKEGNITFNAGESALSASSSASELLTNVPLVTKDPSGKILVRGKEPKILIDDKPVELNLQQLQDLLESMPGSSVEKIEEMTNPPPQYANEQGGVINIVTKKGSVGMNGRLSVYAGTRGDAGTNASFNYRKKGFSLNVNGGAGYNYFEGDGYSKRENIYRDSTNFLNTESVYRNRNTRPNFRMNMNYDISKFHSLNLVLQYNGNDFTNRNSTTYSNLNRNHEIYKLSNRAIRSSGNSYNPNISLSYTLRTKKAGESLKIITNLNTSSANNTKDFYQQFFNPDSTPNGIDSSQQQINDNKTTGYSYRLNYELPLVNKKTFLSFGTFYNLTRSDIEANASYKKNGNPEWLPIDALNNDFTFTQNIYNGRVSVKQLLTKTLSTTVGINAEQTKIRFDLYKLNTDTTNDYWSFLPFASLNKVWKDVLNLTFSYRRTIRRPGINELNPTIDFSDPYNIRFGNPGLLASTADNFDLVFGKTKNSFYANIGLGYNLVRDIFAQVRTLRQDGKTEIT
ncbi:MAG: TonB-dependent receptor, partial [Flavisolibacter sp.]